MLGVEPLPPLGSKGSQEGDGEGAEGEGGEEETEGEASSSGGGTKRDAAPAAPDDSCKKIKLEQ